MSTQTTDADPRPRLLFFYSSTSGSSVRVSGFLAQILQRRRNHETFRMHRIDVNERPDLAERFRVETTPAILVVDGKKVVARAVSPRGSSDLEQTLRNWLR